MTDPLYLTWEGRTICAAETGRVDTPFGPCVDVLDTKGKAWRFTACRWRRASARKGAAYSRSVAIDTPVPDGKGAMKIFTKRQRLEECEG